MKWVSRQHYGEERGVAVFLGAGCFSQGGWKAGAVREGFCKVVQQPSRPSMDDMPDRLVIVDEFCTSHVSSFVHTRQPCKLHLPRDWPRPTDWVPPQGQVIQRLLRPARSLRHAKYVRGLQSLLQFRPAPSAPPGPVQRPQAPPGARWLDRDTDGCMNLQCIGESLQRPIELCQWDNLEALPTVADCEIREFSRRSCRFHRRQATTGASGWLDHAQTSGDGPALCVIKVPEGAVLRGCKKTRRKLREHLRLRAEIHSQLCLIASLFVLRTFLTCLVGYPTPGFPSAPQPPAVQPSQPPDAPPLPPPPPRALAQPAPAQPASMEFDTDSDSESDSDSEPEPQSDSEGIAEMREFVFDPDTQIGVGIDPGVTQAVSAASGVWDPATGQLMADQLRRWKLTKGQVKHASGLNNARRDTERWLAPIKPHLQHLAAASSAGTSLEANLKHITVTLATWDAVWEVYLDPKWARQRLRLYGAQDRALEQFFNKLEEEVAEVSMKRHGHAKQLVVFFGAATIGTGGGWGVDAVLRACCKVVCRPRGAGQRRGRVMLVDEHRTSRVSSAVNGQQPCEEELDNLSATRPAGWKPPAGQVEPRLVRPAWSQERGQPVRGLMWCPVVAPRKPPQAPRSSQAATQPAASEPGPSTPPPAKRSKPAAEPTKGKSKAAKAKPAPQPGRWLDRDCNAALNMQRIGESRWRPLELCYWPDQGALPAKGKEYPGLGYKRVRDKPPKAQEQQQQPAGAQ
ncbi:hypothetical protein QJQ45_028243 [Haematococcus lacustris]|nr:hypothetical protein QJQ45_028243 [Haematococcus lacustris]